MNIRLEFKPQDLWVGAFWKREGDRTDVWVCLIPCVPIHVWWTDFDDYCCRCTESTGMKQTEMIDKLYCELAQFTTANSVREVELIGCIRAIGSAIGCGHTEDADGRSKLVQCVKDQMRTVDMIEELCADEGNSVQILCPNPDGEPNRVVECNGAWTEFEDRRFGGDTLLEASFGVCNSGVPQGGAARPQCIITLLTGTL